MSSELLPQHRRFWWAPLALLLVVGLVNPLMIGGPFALDPVLLRVLVWVPFGVLMAAQLTLVGLVWDRFPEGNPFQVLLGVQAALPLVMALAGRFLLPALLAGGHGIAIYGLWNAAHGVAELALLAGAFHLRRADPESGALGVTVSAALAALGGGWTAVGLAPLLALFWKDPLPSELCGSLDDPARAATCASLTGFLTMLAAPLLVILPLLLRRGSGNMGYGVEWLTGPALLLGALAWASLGARWGREGLVWRVLTRIGVGLLLAVMAIAILVIIAFAGHRLW
ncbi:MAG TPA: hypothetical protein VJ483_03200 [Holophagaceae bacterium]|nr:hypothetical protein [Holophagaceae bacterium]